MAQKNPTFVSELEDYADQADSIEEMQEKNMSKRMLNQNFYRLVSLLQNNASISAVSPWEKQDPQQPRNPPAQN